MPNSSPPNVRKIDLILRTIKRICEVLGVIVLFSMMSLTGVDVFARYLFNSPIRGAFELTEIMLALLVFLSFPVAALSNSHISVEAIDGVANKALRTFSKYFALLVGASVFLVLTIQIWKHATKLQSYGQVTNSLEIPLHWIGFVASGCCFLSFVAMILSIQTKSQDSDID